MNVSVDVRVDFNAVRKDGLVKATRRRANGALHLGQVVRAHDPGETEAHLARVAAIDDETGRVLLDVDWSDDDTRYVHMVALKPHTSPAQIVRSRVHAPTRPAVLLNPGAKGIRVS